MSNAFYSSHMNVLGTEFLKARLLVLDTLKTLSKAQIADSKNHICMQMAASKSQRLKVCLVTIDDGWTS